MARRKFAKLKNLLFEKRTDAGRRGPDSRAEQDLSCAADKRP